MSNRMRARSPTSSSLEGFGDNFERARSTEDLGVYGDAERWGGTSRMEWPESGQAVVVDGDQVVRAHVPDLRARVWQALLAWSVPSPPASANFSMSLKLLVQWGVGQVSASAELDVWTATQAFQFVLFPFRDSVVGGAAASLTQPWFSSLISEGATPLPDIPAAALSITPRVVFSGTGASLPGPSFVAPLFANSADGYTSDDWIFVDCTTGTVAVGQTVTAGASTFTILAVFVYTGIAIVGAPADVNAFIVGGLPPSPCGSGARYLIQLSAVFAAAVADGANMTFTSPGPPHIVRLATSVTVAPRSM